MGRASNSLKTSDVITTPIKLKYSSSFTSSSIGDYGIKVFIGGNEPISELVNVPQETLTYRSIRALYYSNYLTGSFPVSSSHADNWLQSTAFSGSVEADQRYFPTSSYETIQVLSIPREVFGEKIARRSFLFVSDGCTLYDDGNGNVWDLSTLPGYLQALYFQSPDEYFVKTGIRGAHVGNIIYAQGIIIITNQDYQLIFGNMGYLLTEDEDYILTEASEYIRVT
jgi:hypothetical protein